jgi:hypothetical protein
MRVKVDLLRRSCDLADSSSPGYSLGTLPNPLVRERRILRSNTRQLIASRRSESRIAPANPPSPSARRWCTRSAVPVGCSGSAVRLHSGIRCRYRCPRHRDVPQTDIFALDVPHHLPPLLAVHLSPMLLPWMVGCFLGFLLWLGFHANLPTLNSTWPGPVGETYSVSPAGSGRSPFQDNAATIYTIANTGAMLSIGQNAPKKLRP